VVSNCRGEPTLPVGEGTACHYGESVLDEVLQVVISSWHGEPASIKSLYATSTVPPWLWARPGRTVLAVLPVSQGPVAHSDSVLDEVSVMAQC
jgi:hypothetical protein